MDKKEQKEINDFVKKAINSTKKIKMGDSDYFSNTVSQREEGKNNAGSSYDMTKEEIEEKIYNANWEPVTHAGIMEGCKGFKTKLKGLEGILDIDSLPEDTKLYAIDPKGTGKISIGAAHVSKKETDETYIIIGKEEIDGKEEDVVYTFHPGEPVRPSMVETKDIPDGTILSRQQAKELGFDLVKYMSPDMVKEYEEKSKTGKYSLEQLREFTRKKIEEKNKEKNKEVNEMGER